MTASGTRGERRSRSSASTRRSGGSGWPASATSAPSSLRGDARRSAVSYPGIVGHRAVTIRQLDFDIDDDCTLVMHSDGVKERWDLAATPGLARRSATVIAASLLRDAGGRRDDASVAGCAAGPMTIALTAVSLCGEPDVFAARQTGPTDRRGPGDGYERPGSGGDRR